MRECCIGKLKQNIGFAGDASEVIQEYFFNPLVGFSVDAVDCLDQKVVSEEVEARYS